MYLLFGCPIIGWPITALLALAILDPAARAEDPDPCLQNQATLNDCAEESAAKEEAALNAIYQTTLDTVGARQYGRLKADDMVAALKVAQEAWIKSRDATCDFDAALLGGGGSMGRLEHSNCLSSLNSNRMIALQKLVDCYRASDCKFPLPLFLFELRPDASKLKWEE